MCVISFIDIYKKVQRNFPEAKAVQKKDRITIGKALIEIAARYGMTIKPCAEGDDLAVYGADCSRCMTVATYETALHSRLEVPKRKTNQRDVVHEAVQKSWIDRQMCLDLEDMI